MNHTGHFAEKPYPEVRRAREDVFDLGLKKHLHDGHLKIDVTEAREVMRAYRQRTGKGIS